MRDVTAGRRDLAADVRDRRAEGQQEALVALEEACDSTIRVLRSTCGAVRAHAAADRADAANDRRLAAEDRTSASADGGHEHRAGQRLRDATAGRRDLAADVRDREAEGEAEVLLVTEDARDSAIRTLLAAVAVLRDEAAADRADAASDRLLAAADRASAIADSGRARTELEVAHLDDLTGALRRDPGRASLEQEIERCRRSGQPFALAFVDVDGLKALNDREGHAAGDGLLQAVVVALKAKLRSYDPIVRVGGDEFLCGFTNANLEVSRRRADEIGTALERGPAAATISVGLAMLGERDTLEKLIARADADMYSRKQRGQVAT
jgi:diguanylate cyclase (GGDEF)-like protein